MMMVDPWFYNMPPLGANGPPEELTSHLTLCPKILLSQEFGPTALR